jgi:PKD repeat protein
MHIRHSLVFTAFLAAGLLVGGCDSSTSDGELVASFENVQSSTLTVDFKGRSRNPGGEVASRAWEFGDGTTGSGANPSHTYEAQGEYTVTLTVEGSDGSTASTSRDVSVGVAGTQQFEVTIENVGEVFPITKSGAFGTQPAGPGEEHAFTFTAGPEEIPGTGTVLSLATMFVQSNDAFYAFEPGGLSLFKSGGTPIGLNEPADVTDAVGMWDAGTEVDQEPGTGSNQAPRQSQPDTGPDEDGNVVQITDLDDDGMLEDTASVDTEPDTLEYPSVSDVINVTIESEEDPSSGGYRFTVRVENVSDASGATANGEDIPLSPGSYAVHFDQTPGDDDVTFPGFTVDDSASADIERIAEDGSPTGAGSAPGNHVETLDELTGVTVPLSPGAYAAHSGNIQPFSLLEQASDGIEDIAEDGRPNTLAETLGNAGAVGDGGTFGDGPLAPTAGDENNSVTFTVFARPPSDDLPDGDRLSIATMYIQSNDAFYAFDPVGLRLFDDSGSPVEGNVTPSVRLYDAQTEQDEEPGVGVNQAPRQSAFDAGPQEDGTVERIDDANGDPYLDADGFNYSPPSDVIEVTVTPVSQ